MLQFEITPVTPFQQNSCLIWCSDTMEGICTDPGGDLELIIDKIKATQMTLKKIVLTHGHLDHVGGALSLSKTFQVPIIGPHKDDDFWLQILPQQAAMLQLKEVATFAPDQWLEEASVITVGNLTLDVLHCPGHTPGHVVLVNHEAKLVLAGDVLFKGSIGRTDFPKGDMETLLNSIQNKLFTLGDDYQVIPGHGPTTTIGHEKATNPFVVDFTKG